MNRVGILGAGAWGTALAKVARRAGRTIVVQAHDPAVAQAIEHARCNERYLPGITLDPDIRVVAEPAEAVAAADVVLLAVPAQHLRATLRRAGPSWPSGIPAVICAKGIEQQTCALLSEVVEQTLPDAPVAVLTGPSFAVEVAHELPTAVTLACADSGLRQALPRALGTRAFRVYSSDDVIGAQLGGAVKNVLAIACGIVRGKRLGDNARAALITRGLAEMARFAVALGAQSETLMGLSGLGDLVLTCSALQSRNFSLGVALGEGRGLSDIMGERITVTEGVYTARVVVEMAGRAGVEMPICAAVDAALAGLAPLEETIAGLLARPFKAEVFAA
jgi:glycerol-3-phosphate dehydrogenase (NAD(P)+)